ncbi:MAG: hypothetical protein MK074_00625 [Phycisphaerales bacterium]|nr:hypothetical protein [Phycisphaerales bacterium]
MRCLCPILAAAVVTWPAVAQIDPTHNAPMTVPTPAPGLEWVLLDPLGVWFQVPAGTRLMHRPTSNQPHLLLRDGDDSPAWSLRAEAVPPPAGATGPAMAVLHGNAVLAKADPQSVLHEGTLKVGDRHAHTAWVREEDASGTSVAYGWLALPRSDGQVMLLTAITTPAMLPQARPEIERIFASVRPVDTSESQLLGSIGLAKSESLLKDGLEDKLRRLDGLRRVFRIWQPDPRGGGRELAYGVLEAAIGTASAIRPDLTAATIGDDQHEGLIVTVHLRYAVDPAADRYLDQVMRMWLAFDGSSEQWYLNATRKQHGRQAAETELGIREAASAGAPRPTLTVIRQSSTGERSPFENPVHEGWLPRPLEWLLMDIIDPAESTEYVWAAWDPASGVPRVLMRRDQWSPVPDGTWIVRTWQGMDALPSIARVTRNGAVFIDRPDGTRIEVVDDQRIADLWQSAGLKLN